MDPLVEEEVRKDGRGRRAVGRVLRRLDEDEEREGLGRRRSFVCENEKVLLERKEDLGRS